MVTFSSLTDNVLEGIALTNHETRGGRSALATGMNLWAQCDAWEADAVSRSLIVAALESEAQYQGVMPIEELPAALYALAAPDRDEFARREADEGIPAPKQAAFPHPPVFGLRCGFVGREGRGMVRFSPPQLTVGEAGASLGSQSLPCVANR
jgi:hypothetical protein